MTILGAANRQKRNATKRSTAWLVLLAALGYAAFGPASPVAAHGKEVEIEVTSLTPDPQRPLSRLYHAVVAFADGDPVEDAAMEMFAMREEDGSEFGPVAFRPLAQPGRYVADVTYERFGTWQITVRVSEPGEGEAEFVDAVLPGAAGARVENVGPSPETLAVLFKFDGGDVTNIIFRISHSLAGALWVALMAIPAAACRFLPPDGQARVLLPLRRIYKPAAIVSLLVILASGIHASIWGTPIRAPGVFDLETLLAIPFGTPYFLALLGMIVAWLVMAAASWKLGQGLRMLGTRGEAEGKPSATVRVASLVGLVTALVLIPDIVVLLYLHNISHLALVIPQ